MRNDLINLQSQFFIMLIHDATENVVLIRWKFCTRIIVLKGEGYRIT